MKVGDFVEFFDGLWVIRKIGNDRHLNQYIKVRSPTDAERVGARLVGVAYTDLTMEVSKRRIYMNRGGLSNYAFPILRATVPYGSSTALTPEMLNSAREELPVGCLPQEGWVGY